MLYYVLIKGNMSKTMKSGNIFVDKEGTNICNIKVEKRNQVLREYYVMREYAKKNKDKFFYVNAQEWEDFFCNTWSSDSPYWEGVDMTYITSLQVCAYPQNLIDDISEFEALPEPKSHGGYGYDGHPSEGYVHNIRSWKMWHSEFYYEHPEEIDWEGTNGIMPCRDKVIEILRQELLDLQSKLEPDGSNNIGLPHKKFRKLKYTNWNDATDETIVSEHNDIVIRHQGKNLKAYSEKIGTLICSVNYYHHETELEELEKDHGNTNVSIIFSIKKNDKYQFISIDTAHGKFELCDDSGTHKGEIRFDGSSNGIDTIEDSHGLCCIAEWKKKYGK